MQECVFCKIVKGELPSAKLREGKNALAILDINPLSWGHSLIISKKHYENLLETPSEVLEEMILLSKEIGRAVITAGGFSAFNLLQSSGSAAGQVIMHIHFHIIPRKPDDGIGILWKTFKYKEGELQEIAEKIKGRLPQG
jgi:histidine triad (HIT) family protein